MSARSQSNKPNKDAEKENGEHYIYGKSDKLKTYKWISGAFFFGEL